MDGIDTAFPDEVIVSSDRMDLRLLWTDGRDTAVTAHRLRSACRCAWCTRDRVLNRFQIEGASVKLVDVETLGSHGLHIKFSDGHERGIYPWPYLRHLSDGLPAASFGRHREPISTAANAV